MGILIAILLMVGAVLLIFGISALCIWLERTFPANDYDERQQVARGRAYRFSWFVALIYYFGVTMYVAITDASSAVTSSLMMAGIGVTVMAMEFYCLLTHAAVGRLVSPVKAMVGYFLLGAVHLGIAIYRLLAESYRYNDVTWLYTYMFIAISLLGMGTIRLVQHLCRDRE